jgi:hypothetical protein
MQIHTCMKFLKLSLYTFILLFISFKSFSQESATDTLRENSLKVFVDCSCGCDLAFFKKEINFINYVRDPKEAELYILLTSQTNGSGGNTYFFFFQGQQSLKGMTDTLKYSCNANNTSDEIRDGQLRTLKLGLVRYIAQTPEANQLEISSKQSEKEDETPADDKWKSWVFSISSNAYFSGQKLYNYFNISGQLNVTRITPDWKIKFQLYTGYNEQRFVIDEDIYKTYSRSYSFYHLLTRSLSDHWSIGGSANAYHSTYSNIKYGLTLTPAVEYNVFPYSQSTSRSLTIFYKIGPEYNQYIDTTIFDKTSELLFFHRLVFTYNIIKKWGSISTSLYGSNYLHDFSKYNLSLYSSLSIRIFKGLSFEMYANYSLIHDQLGLPKGDVSDEDILLQRRELATQYSYYLSTGLSYTFGSIYNNVVNPRFDN